MHAPSHYEALKNLIHWIDGHTSGLSLTLLQGLPAESMLVADRTRSSGRATGGHAGRRAPLSSNFRHH